MLLCNQYLRFELCFVVETYHKSVVLNKNVDLFKKSIEYLVLKFVLGNEIQISSYFASFNTQPNSLKCKKPTIRRLLF